jgi:hypothetical protein
MVSVWRQIATEARRLVKVALMAMLGVVVLIIASLFSDDPTKTFFRILSLLGTAMVLFSVAMMLVTFRRARSLIPGALIVSLLTTLSVAGVQLLFAQQRPGMLLVLLPVTAGAMVGAGWARTTRVFIDGELIRSQGNVWYLLVWAATFLLNQLLGMMAGGTPMGGLMALLVGTGIAVGNNVSQLWRYRQASTLLATLPQVELQGGNG